MLQTRIFTKFLHYFELAKSQRLIRLLRIPPEVKIIVGCADIPDDVHEEFIIVELPILREDRIPFFGVVVREISPTCAVHSLQVIL